MAKLKHQESIEQKRFTKYEKARIIGSRALQLSMGAPYLVKLAPEDLERIKYNPIEIAKMEFEAGVIPMDVVREVKKRIPEKPAEKKEKEDKEEK